MNGVDMGFKIDNILSEEDCKKVLFLLDESKKFIDFRINKYSENVVGFLAEHYLLTISSSDKNERNTFKKYDTFFLKSMPLLNAKQKAYIKNMDVFKKEILMYKNLLSEFLKLTSKPFAPKYYFSKSDECMVIEDISSNYQVCNVEYLNYGKIKGALESLAVFHAASIIFEERRSTAQTPYRINEHFTKELKEGTFSFKEGHVRNMWCKSAAKCLADLTRLFTDNHREIAKKIEDYIFSEEGLRRSLRPSKKYRNVICHDDLWRNNIMFSKNNDCLFVDFQLTRYTPPVFDVLLMLNINVEREYLNQNIWLFLEMYYGFLKNELSLNNIDIENVLSKDDFITSVEDYTLAALTEAGLYGTNVYLPEHISKVVVSNMDVFEEFSFKNRSPFIMKEFGSNEAYRKRFSNVLVPLFNMFEEV
ncbi:hypothetical protein NQ318_004001 [Aromia moschata]|uniref:CHK kinase-like domain-containing protein n=1 Tax=Aromia moschata TaxID=1265417 RepID=A0AAV8Z9Y6_9CUCU|nr:hypothetical protein NQ318_004001 [Aromia moschata]